MMERDKPLIIGHLEKSLNYSIFDTKWIPCSAKFVAIGSKPNGTGIIEIYELEASELKLVSTIEKKTSFKCGSFAASSLRDRHLAVGDFAGRLLVLDLENPDVPVYNVQAHSDIINGLDGVAGLGLNIGAPEIVTGSRDGAVKVWDPRQKDLPVACISAAEPGETGARDCWTVAFGNSYSNVERAVAAGYDNGDVKIIDLRKMAVLWEKNVKNGVCGLEFDRRDIAMNKLAVGTLEGGLHVFDLRTQHPEKGFASVTERDAGRALGTNGVISGSKATVWAVKHLPQNRDIFVSCGGTGSVRLWKYQYPDKRSKEATDGHQMGVAGILEMLKATTISSQPINCFDWNQDRLGLAVCGAFDQTIRVVVATKLNLH